MVGVAVCSSRRSASRRTTRNATSGGRAGFSARADEPLCVAHRVEPVGHAGVGDRDHPAEHAVWIETGLVAIERRLPDIELLALPERVHDLERPVPALGWPELDDDSLVVADIRDRERVLAVFQAHQPEVVFHAAALKHLTLLESHPHEGVKTNVWGTWNVLQAAAATGVGRFVNISTDKAADPTSVLGYTKRITERLTSWFA